MTMAAGISDAHNHLHWILHSCLEVVYIPMNNIYCRQSYFYNFHVTTTAAQVPVSPSRFRAKMGKAPWQQLALALPYCEPTQLQTQWELNPIGPNAKSKAGGNGDWPVH